MALWSPIHDRSISASSKNYRYSVNMQVVIDANTRLVVAVGDPTPGNRNDCRAYTDSRVDQQCRGAKGKADGGYQGNAEVIMPYRKPARGNRRYRNGKRTSTPSTRASGHGSSTLWRT